MVYFLPSKFFLSFNLPSFHLILVILGASLVLPLQQLCWFLWIHFFHLTLAQSSPDTSDFDMSFQKKACSYSRSVSPVQTATYFNGLPAGLNAPIPMSYCSLNANKPTWQTWKKWHETETQELKKSPQDPINQLYYLTSSQEVHSKCQP